MEWVWNVRVFRGTTGNGIYVHISQEDTHSTGLAVWGEIRRHTDTKQEDIAIEKAINNVNGTATIGFESMINQRRENKASFSYLAFAAAVGAG